jgi:CopA family copper-resistance protein
MKKTGFCKRMPWYTLLLLLGGAWIFPSQAPAQIKEYYLNIMDKRIKVPGRWVKVIEVNDSIPGPTLYFTEGDSAVIHVTNKMKRMESLIHWHGLLIPNSMDGVPSLTTPPIKPGKTFTYRFRIRQHGTFWYHAHSMLQEQSGVYGSFIIEPKKETLRYDKEIVLLLSEFTIEQPAHILNNLKRNTEWYAIKKRQAQSLNRVVANHALGERIQMAWQRMPPMDISDVYYNHFTTNGVQNLYFSNVHPEERIRLRVIAGSSSTFFHIQFAGGKMELIASDGSNVQPVMIDRILMGAAETYDFIITIPSNGMYEFRATAQDGSGYTSVYFGKGDLHAAPSLPKPDLYHMMGIIMQGMEGMKMKGMNMSQKTMTQEFPYIQKAYLDREDVNVGGSLSMNMTEMNMDRLKSTQQPDKNRDDRKDMDMPPDTSDRKNNTKSNQMNMPDNSVAGKKKVHVRKNMKGMNMKDMNMGNMQEMNMGEDTLKSDDKPDSIIFNYDMLRALHSTSFDTAHHKVRELTFNLTGTMWRYTWSINNKTLSEADSIRIDPGEILRITMVNQTMMYHPMHLHGHYFRVLNASGDSSPLKNVVIVPPMRTITIEFAADENSGAWFFHCHILYHMMTGMGRIFQYSNYSRPDTLTAYPLKNLMHDDKSWFFWGNATLSTTMGEFNALYSNRNNAFMLNGDAGNWWKSNFTYETTATYEHFVTPYLRPYIGFVSSNKNEYLDYFKNYHREVPVQDNRGILGLHYLLPFFINADLRIDDRAHFRLQLEGETWLFPRIWLHYLWNTDNEYELGLEGRLSQYVSITGGYHSDYGWLIGTLLRF